MTVMNFVTPKAAAAKYNPWSNKPASVLEIVPELKKISMRYVAQLKGNKLVAVLRHS
jgi:hypothetical protein